VIVGIYQGERETVAHNIKLGEFEFLLDPPRPRQSAVVLLTFHLDADDILHVSAVDKLTRATRTLTIKDSQNLDRATVERLRQEARQGRHGDRAEVRRLQHRQELQLRAAELIRQLDAAAHDESDEANVRRVRDFAAQVYRAVAAGDDELLELAARDLESAWEQLGELAPPKEPENTPPPEAPAPPTEGQVNCANCGARLPKGFAFCGKCGVPLKKDACSSCGAALVEGFSFCGKCGAKLE
jgi:molecular chaperone DnaK (HSP70)